LEITSGTKNSDDLIAEIGGRYCNHVIRSFRTSNSPIPAYSHHPSRPSFSTTEALMNELLEGSGKDHKTAKKNALVRDGFRCVVSGRYDMHAMTASAELFEAVTRFGKSPASLECCHILSESTLQAADPSNLEKAAKKRTHATTVLTVLDTFGLEKQVAEFVVKDGVHHLSNILTMEPNYHKFFDELKVWFEETETSNKYKLCSTISVMFASDFPLNETPIVEFKVNPKALETFPGREFPLPDRKLLTVHAACARVAHMSGAAEYIDKFDRDVEDTLVLSKDGSDAPLIIGRLELEIIKLQRESTLENSQDIMVGGSF